MANDPQTQYQQALWELKQLREEAHEAGVVYANKLERIAKRVKKVNDRLAGLGKTLSKDNGNNITTTPVMAAPTQTYTYNPNSNVELRQ